MNRFNIITIFFIVSISSCSENKKVKNDLVIENIKGEVSSIVASTYFAIEKFGEVDDKRGNWLKKIIFINSDFEFDKRNIVGIIERKIEYY